MDGDSTLIATVILQKTPVILESKSIESSEKLGTLEKSSK